MMWCTFHVDPGSLYKASRSFVCKSCKASIASNENNNEANQQLLDMVIL